MAEADSKYIDDIVRNQDLTNTEIGTYELNTRNI